MQGLIFQQLGRGVANGFGCTNHCESYCLPCVTLSQDLPLLRLYVFKRRDITEVGVDRVDEPRLSLFSGAPPKERNQAIAIRLDQKGNKRSHSPRFRVQGHRQEGRGSWLPSPLPHGQVPGVGR